MKQLLKNVDPETLKEIVGNIKNLNPTLQKELIKTLLENPNLMSEQEREKLLQDLVANISNLI